MNTSEVRIVEPLAGSSLYGVIFKGCITENMIEQISELKIGSIVFTQGDFSDLACLASHVKNVIRIIVKTSNFDVSELKVFENLEYLDIQSKLSVKQSIPSFKKLAYLSVYYAKCIDFSNFDGSKVKSLTINNWIDESLCPLKDIKNLENLTLVDARKLKRLEGIENLSKLKGFYIDSANQLEDISALGKLKELRSLKLIGCKSIQEHKVIGRLSNLQTLVMHKCSPIDSLFMLDNIKSIDTLGLKGTVIIDNDLSLLKRLPVLKRFDFTASKAYNVSKKDLLSLIESNPSYFDKYGEELWEPSLFKMP